MGLIESGKDKAKFDQMSKTEQEIVGILNLTEKDKAKTLPIYFTEEEAMADPSGNTVAGEIDYNKLNNMASQRVAASGIYSSSIKQQTDFATNLKPSMIDKITWQVEWKKRNQGKSTEEMNLAWDKLTQEQQERASAAARQASGLPPLSTS
jgi:hypothetical protein